MDPATAKEIYRLFALKVPTTQICVETGADKAEVSRMRKAWRNGGRQAPQELRDEVRPDPSRELKAIPMPEKEQDEEGDRRAFADPVMKGLLELANSVIADYNDADALTDPRMRTYARTVYGKNAAAVYRQLGEWAGLKDPGPEPPASNPVDVFLAASMKQIMNDHTATEWDIMDLDPDAPEAELREAVQRLQRRHHPTTWEEGGGGYAQSMADDAIIKAFEEGTATRAQYMEVLKHHTDPRAPAVPEDDMEVERRTTTPGARSTACSPRRCRRRTSAPPQVLTRRKSRP